MTAAERVARLFPRVLSPASGKMKTRLPSSTEIEAAIREAEAAARAAAFREEVEMAISESEQAAAGWGCKDHASPGIESALSSFAVELVRMADARGG